MTGTERTELSRLLARAADGDRAALDPLFAAAWPVTHAFCRRLVGDSDADDAAQEALTKVFARAATFDPARDGLTWILTIASWECRTVRRRRGRRRDHSSLDVAATAPDAEHVSVLALAAPRSERPDELAERRELLAAAAAIVGALSPTDAGTLVAAWTDDAAARAALAPATFRKRLERALVRFRAAWRSNHEP